MIRATGPDDRRLLRDVRLRVRRGAGRAVLAVEPEDVRAARLSERCGFVRPDEPPPLPRPDGNDVHELRL